MPQVVICAESSDDVILEQLQDHTLGNSEIDNGDAINLLLKAVGALLEMHTIMSEGAEVASPKTRLAALALLAKRCDFRFKGTHAQELVD